MTQSSHRHPLKGTGIRLHPYHYWLALAVLLAVAVSGLVWTVLHDLLQWADAPFVRQILQLHGAFAFCSLILFGSMLPQHIRFAWVARRNRVTGTLTGIVFLLLTISAYGLYYGPEDWSGLAKTAHLVMGIAAVAAVPLHMLIGRKRHEGYRASASKSARH